MSIEAKARCREVFDSVLTQLRELGMDLVRSGDHVEAGIALVAERVLFQFLLGGDEPAAAAAASPPASDPRVTPEKTTIRRCRHEFNGDNGTVCAICGAARKRAARAPRQAVIPGGAP